MRFAILALAGVLLSGCGYVGDPLPPALNIPTPVSDLRVMQRGDKLLLDFTAPALTTEAIGITSFASAEVQVDDRVIPIPIPNPGTAAHTELPAREWVGSQIRMQVILGGPKGRKSGPSNVVAFRVDEPLKGPVDIKAEPHPEGVRVSWTPGDSRSSQYRITRVPAGSAVVDKPEYIDRAVEFGKEYKYSIVATLGGSESLPVESAVVVPKDVFPPAAPANLQAIAGLNTIELTWERNTEPGLKNYRVYRDNQVLADAVDAPSFSDKQVTSGQKYRYVVTALDQAGNESARSKEAEITAP